MDREFVDLYNRELALFYEHAKEFALMYPGIADRLGGMTHDRSDPMFAALLQGTAFLAARVQLKIKHEFPEFTDNLIEQLLPGFLAPTPSAMLVQVQPKFGDPGLRDGRTMPRGALLEALYRQVGRNVSCRYSLCSDLSIWPFELVKAEYHASPGPLHALKLEGDFRAGLRLTLRVRAAARAEDEPKEEAARKDPTCLFAGCAISSLPIHFIGPEADAAMLYEQIFAQRPGLHLRYLDEFGNPQFVDMGNTAVEQIGFDEDEALLPHNPRLFGGFSLLQEYFTFPRKFLGFRLVSQGKTGNRKRELFPVAAREIDIFLTFREPVPRLAAAIDSSMFALYAAPAVNLFPMNTDRVSVSSSQHEYQVIPDRSHPVDFEAHSVLEVFAHYAGQARKEPMSPLYTAPPDLDPAQRAPHYTIRRLPRRRTAAERRTGSASAYIGTEMYLSIALPEAPDEENRIQGLSVRALCTNRHLAEELPVGTGKAEFTFAADTSLTVICAVPPTRPKAPPLHLKNEAGHTAWHLINALSLNHVGLTRTDGKALRDVLSLFADLGDPVIERHIASLRTVSTRPVVRRLKSRAGVGAARGIEVTVSFEEKSFEGSGVFVLSAVLERFLAEYAALNHFTQTVVTTVERGEIARWRPRSGSRRPL